MTVQNIISVYNVNDYIKDPFLLHREFNGIQTAACFARSLQCEMTACRVVVGNLGIR